MHMNIIKIALKVENIIYFPDPFFDDINPEIWFSCLVPFS